MKQKYICIVFSVCMYLVCMYVSSLTHGKSQYSHCIFSVTALLCPSPSGFEATQVYSPASRCVRWSNLRLLPPEITWGRWRGRPCGSRKIYGLMELASSFQVYIKSVIHHSLNPLQRLGTSCCYRMQTQKRWLRKLWCVVVGFKRKYHCMWSQQAGTEEFPHYIRKHNGFYGGDMIAH